MLSRHSEWLVGKSEVTSSHHWVAMKNLGNSAALNYKLRRKREKNMSKKLYVGGLSWNTDESGLRATFEQYGELDEVKIISDRNTGRSRGFGFVTFADRDSADQAISALDGQQLDGRSITVNEARERGDSRGGGGGGGRGGYR